jgi:hypothetical protein
MRLSMSPPRALVALPLTALLLGACYDPKLASGSFACGSSNGYVCPDGFTCDRAQSLCVRGGHADASVDGGVDASPDGPPDPTVIGCSDGTREGLDLATFPHIAACRGAWDHPGIIDTLTPLCGRAAGNDGINRAGTTCSVADLCAVGWHVCLGHADVELNGGGAHPCADLAGQTSSFYATRQSGTEVAGISGYCAASGDDDVFGCGGLGARPATVNSGCSVLDRVLSIDLGACAAPWGCGTDDQHEAANVVKATPASGGGVLCCKN